jgi:tRNA G10  N-methylase Trm11
MNFFYLLGGPPEERELAALELEVLGGIRPDGACGEGPVAVDLTGAAYVRLCAETIATADSLDALVTGVVRQRLTFEAFRLEVHRPAPRPTEDLPQIVRRLADSWEGQPNLDHPRVRLAVVAQRGRWRVGRIVSESRCGWRLAAPPGDYSAALPAQMARALVNLVAAPGDTLLDPCAGVGTVVAQAASRGIRVVGLEISKKLAGRAAAYVRSTGAGDLIVAGDARTWGGHYDAAVVDLPYGRASIVPKGLYPALLGNLRRLTDRAVILAAQPLDGLLAEAGLRILATAQVRCGSLVRHIHLTAM